MNITLDQAKSFCTLIEAGSYQAAATELGKSHPAVVYSVRTLEAQCGVQLLDRSLYRSSLTPAGQRIYHQCRMMLASALQLEELCHQLADGWEPSLLIVFDGVLPAQPLLRLFQDFKSRQVPTRLDIYSDFLTGVEKSFLDLDAHFMISVLQPKTAGLQSVPLSPLTTMLVAHRDHALFADERRWSLSELKSFNFFTVRGADKSLNLGTKELEETSTFYLSDFSLKKAAILEGVGFGWLPKYLIAKELKSGLLRPIHWEHGNRRVLHPHLYFKRKRALGRAAQLILERLR